MKWKADYLLEFRLPDVLIKTHFGDSISIFTFKSMVSQNGRESAINNALDGSTYPN